MPITLKVKELYLYKEDECVDQDKRVSREK